MIKVGIIGLGRIADLHRLGYVDNPEACIHAVCDVDPEAVEKRRGEWQTARGYLDYHELLADPDIDAVEILTPQTVHEPMVIDAARAGKHIAVQKPMTISLEGAERMLDAVAQANITYKVTDNYLFYPPIAFAKRLIDEGVIGEPCMLRMKFVGGLWKGGWAVPAETWAWRLEEVMKGRGLQTFDHGHHMWAVAWYLLGEIERVVSWIDTTLGVIDCPAVIMWKYKAARRYGVCDYSQATDLAIPSKYYSCDEWFEITGSRGILLVRRCTGNLQDGPAVSLYTNDGWTHHDVESDWSAGFRLATRNFIGAIQGTSAPLLTGQQATEILRFAFALRRSSDERREVCLDELRGS
jgi:predicted dehydrogenase